jgi:hypothetical protein
VKQYLQDTRHISNQLEPSYSVFRSESRTTHQTPPINDIKSLPFGRDIASPVFMLFRHKWKLSLRKSIRDSSDDDDSDDAIEDAYGKRWKGDLQIKISLCPSSSKHNIKGAVKFDLEYSNGDKWFRRCRRRSYS